MKLKLIAGSLFAAGALLLANPASALTISGEYTDLGLGLSTIDDYDENFLRVTITCSNCAVLDYPGADIADAEDDRPDSTDAGGFATDGNFFWNDFGNGLAAEENWVDAVLGFDAGDGIKNEDPFATGTVANEFCSSAEYVLVKVGEKPEWSLLHNTSGGENCYIWSGGTGDGLSHITQFGGNGTVSEPGILGLFGAGLLMLGFLRRRTIV